MTAEEFGNENTQVTNVGAKVRGPSAATLAGSFFIGFAGLAASSLAFVEAWRVRLASEPKLACLIPGDETCGDILAKGWGRLLAIPLGAFGMVFWVGFLTFLVLIVMRKSSRQFFVSGQLAASFLKFVSTLALFFVLIWVIDGNCVLWSICQGISATFFMISMYQYLKWRGGKPKPEAETVLRLRKMVPWTTGPVLLATALSSFILEWKATAKEEQTHRVAVAATPFPEDWIRVNRENEPDNGMDYRAGNDSAKLVVQLFTDPESPEARDAAAALSSAIETIGSEQALYVVKFYPLDAACNKKGNVNTYGCMLSVAARCAGRQGKFWEFLNWAYEAQDRSVAERRLDFADSGLEAEAMELGLESEPFQECLGSIAELIKVREDIERADLMGIDLPPFVVVNGIRYPGDPTDSREVAKFLRLMLQRTSKP